jgi:hypothetical protein
MRTMPTIIHDETQGCFEVSRISAYEWWSRLNDISLRIQDRCLDETERNRAERMANRNWTLRVIASVLFGEDEVSTYFSPEK